MEADINNNSSWIIKSVMKQRERERENIGFVQQIQGKILQKPKFSMKEMYTEVIDGNTRVIGKVGSCLIEQGSELY